jgi:hypothetical protein
MLKQKFVENVEKLIFSLYINEVVADNFAFFCGIFFFLKKVFIYLKVWGRIGVILISKGR